jgi:hypothetical protein
MWPDMMEEEIDHRGLLGEAELALSSLERAVDHLTTSMHHPTPSDPRKTFLPSFLPGPPSEGDELGSRRMHLRALNRIREQMTALSDRILRATIWTDGDRDSQQLADPPAPPVPLISSPPSPPPILTPNHARPVYVEVADGLEVEAMLLPDSCTTPDDVLSHIRGPMLCYVPAWNHFAIRLGSHLLHGNVGQIYPVGSTRPIGVKSCLRCRPGQIAPECPYYHDPALGVSKKPDSGVGVRNYIADAFCFHSRFETPRRVARYGQRHFGSHGSLRLDMEAMSSGEVQRFLDQVAHDLVCAALLLHNRPA